MGSHYCAGYRCNFLITEIEEKVTGSTACSKKTSTNLLTENEIVCKELQERNNLKSNINILVQGHKWKGRWESKERGDKG